ncbi:MAG TPA: hypothetical protein VHU90_12260 [Galbitalea sp.]|nr:hypothetical protein [Galbitalea sp.]
MNFLLFRFAMDNSSHVFVLHWASTKPGDLQGAMGCACVGVPGLIGLALGYTVATGPALVSALLRRKPAM